MTSHSISILKLPDTIVGTTTFFSVDELRNFVHILNKYQNVDIDVICGHMAMDGKSLMGVMSYGLGRELIVTFSAYDPALIEELSNNTNFKLLKFLDER